MSGPFPQLFGKMGGERRKQDEKNVDRFPVRLLVHGMRGVNEFHHCTDDRVQPERFQAFGHFLHQQMTMCKHLS